MARMIFYRRIYLNKPEVLQEEGPFILACTHPDSFIDGVILCTLFDTPVHILTRGDAFKKPRAKKVLESIYAIPIYRLSEGKENLTLNDKTFQISKGVIQKGEGVLIFSEGLCVNEWKLRPLKKGTARLAFQGWSDAEIGAKLKVIPVGINVSSFRKFGKRLLLNFGDPIYMKDFEDVELNGKNILQFNEVLWERLKPLTIEKPTEMPDTEFERQFHEGDLGPFKSLKGIQKALAIILLFVPALLGFIANAPIYFPLKSLAKKRTYKTVFYDSVLFGMLMLLYPIYCLLFSSIVGLCFGFWVGVVTFVALPLTGKTTVVFKNL